MGRILTVTLNPALDITTGVARMVEGAKMRCDPPQLDPGGGGANVSRAIDHLGGESLPFIVTGGALGRAYQSLFADTGLDAVWHDSGVQTRESVAVHDHETDRQYRFVLPGEAWTESDWMGVLAALDALMGDGDRIVLSGSQPPGVPPEFPILLRERARAAGARMILDTSGKPLEAAAKPDAGFHVLRMDRHEGAELLGLPEIDVAQAEKLARDLVADGTAEIAVVTVGGEGAIGVTQTEAWRVVPPKVKVLSSTGAGDSFVGALSMGICDRWDFDETLAFAMAAAADAVTTRATDLCSKAGTEAKLKETRRIKL